MNEKLSQNTLIFFLNSSVKLGFGLLIKTRTLICRLVVDTDLFLVFITKDNKHVLSGTC